MKSFFFLSTLLAFRLFAPAQAQLPVHGPVSTNHSINLNLPDEADAYSWLSADGLRLYFTRDSSDEFIWMSRRKDIHQVFGQPERIRIFGLNENKEIFSSWLTEDEQTLYFINRQSEGKFNTSLYKAQWDANRKGFTNPVKISLQIPEDANPGSVFLSGPSLTSDLSQLYLYYSDNMNEDRIAVFNGTDGLHYTFGSFLMDSNNFCPGTLSSDNLSFYLTLRNQSHILLKLSRDHINEPFEKVTQYEISSSGLLRENFYQPFVNEKLGIMSLTRGTGTWSSNNIVLMTVPGTIESQTSTVITNESAKDSIVPTLVSHDNTVSKQIRSGEPETDNSERHTDPGIIKSVKDQGLPNRFQYTVYPNPAGTTLWVKPLAVSEYPEAITFQLISINGLYTKSWSTESAEALFNMDLTDLPNGMYYCRILRQGSVPEIHRIEIFH